MKRFLVIALALLVAGASVFALDLGNGLTLGVDTWAGVQVNTKDDNNDATDDTNVVLKHSDGTTTGDQGFRTQATLGYTSDWGGAKLRLRTMNPNGFPINAVIAYGWANLFDSKIVVSGGYLGGDHLWNLSKLSGNVFDPGHDGVTGARVEFKNLVEGLSFGLALPVPVAQDKNDKGKPISDVFGGLKFGALYKSSAFSVVAAASLEPKQEAKAGTDEVSLYTTTDNGTTYNSAGKISKVDATPERDAYVDAIAAVEVPVSPLNIIVDVRYNGDKTNGYTRIAPLIRFSSGPLGAHARADIGIKNDKVGKPDEGGNHFGGGAIKSGETTKIAFRVGGDYAVTSAVKPYFRVGSDNVSYLDGNGLYVQPGFTFAVGGANIEIFDKVNKIGAKDEATRKGITNQFQIDFKWSF